MLPFSRQAAHVYRVITYTSDQQGNRKIDPGPWLKSESEAEYWADHLRTLGYRAEVEKLRGDVTGKY